MFLLAQVTGLAINSSLPRVSRDALWLVAGREEWAGKALVPTLLAGALADLGDGLCPVSLGCLAV